MEGTWSLDAPSKTVSMTMTKIAGMDISKMPGANTARARQAMVLSGELDVDGTAPRLTLRNSDASSAAGSSFQGLVSRSGD